MLFVSCIRGIQVAQDRCIRLKLQGSKGPVHAYNAGHLFLYASNTLEIYFQCRVIRLRLNKSLWLD